MLFPKQWFAIRLLKKNKLNSIAYEEKSLITIFMFLLHTTTIEDIFISVGIEQPVNHFVTHFLSLSFVVTINASFFRACEKCSCL